jgi:hypothetical protein
VARTILDDQEPATIVAVAVAIALQLFNECYRMSEYSFLIWEQLASIIVVALAWCLNDKKVS